MQYKERVFQVRDDMRISLRNAESGDAKALLALIEELGKESYYNELNPEDSPLDEAQIQADIEACLSCRNKLYMLVFEQDNLIGAAHISPLSRSPKSQHRASYRGAVLKHYWGYGIGSVLTQEMFKIAKDMDFEQYEVESFADHHRAIEMYSALGFVEWGRIKRAFRIGNDDIDLLYMGKIL